MNSESPNSPETVSLPKYLLIEFEDAFSRLWLVVSKVTSQMEQGAVHPHLLTPIPRHELNHALDLLAAWRWAA
jgi:hypothetical protein